MKEELRKELHLDDGVKCGYCEHFIPADYPYGFCIGWTYRSSNDGSIVHVTRIVRSDCEAPYDFSGEGYECFKPDPNRIEMMPLQCFKNKEEFK